MENVESRVKKIVAEQLGVNEADVKIDSRFVDDLGADSLDTVELVMALEEEFETEIPDEEAEKISTVGDAITYIEKHMTQCNALNIPYSWKAIQYMVTLAQYGGRITDALDIELFSTYGQQWLTEAVFTPNYIFNTTFTEYHYSIPDTSEHTKFMDHIATFPVKDSPIIFGLHPNADLTYRLNESIAMLTTLVDTQPKEAASAGGKSREEEVKERIEKDLLPQLPPDFIEADIEERLKLLKGPKGLSETGKGVPLNVFLFYLS